MISLEIKDTKIFMSHLLIKDSFNSMLLSEAELAMANTYTIQGKINRSFYTDEEYESLSNKDYSLWEDIKPFCYSLVKGSSSCQHEDNIQSFLTDYGGCYQ